MANRKKEKAQKNNIKRVFRVNDEMDTHIDKRATNFDSYSGYLRWLIKKDMDENNVEK